MIKIGDRVAPFFKMSEIGTVVNMIPEKVRTWHIGGSAGHTFRVVVMLDEGKAHKEYKMSELMRVE